MRTTRPQDRLFYRLLGLLALVAGLALGSGLAGMNGALVGSVLGGLIGLLLNQAVNRREVRRQAALAVPLPESARIFLRERYDHYNRLPPDWLTRFDDDLRIFLTDKRVTGVEVEVTEELRLLVAASAVTVSLGWPDYDWSQLTEVLLYPQDFDRDYRLGVNEIAGQAHPWGTVILSVPSLRRSFDDPDDGYHVGIHEFAHLLDLSQTRFDGIPEGLPTARSREWVAVVEKEMERLRRGKSALDPYGGEHPVEFLAVAVEAFFEMPLTLRKRHREVYSILTEYFGQDPAAWDDARGLVLD